MEKPFLLSKDKTAEQDKTVLKSKNIRRKKMMLAIIITMVKQKERSIT